MPVGDAFGLEAVVTHRVQHLPGLAIVVLGDHVAVAVVAIPCAPVLAAAIDRKQPLGALLQVDVVRLAGHAADHPRLAAHAADLAVAARPEGALPGLGLPLPPLAILVGIKPVLSDHVVPIGGAIAAVANLLHVVIAIPVRIPGVRVGVGGDHRGIALPAAAAFVDHRAPQVRLTRLIGTVVGVIVEFDRPKGCYAMPP